MNSEDISTYRDAAWSSAVYLKGITLTIQELDTEIDSVFKRLQKCTDTRYLSNLTAQLQAFSLLRLSMIKKESYDI